MSSSLTKADIEILIATMNRTSLDFLIPMFPQAHFSEYPILIINQTDEGKLLQSEYDNVRVINSFEKGLSKSRNLAIKNAKGKIVVLADDDVVYSPNFDSEILNAFAGNNAEVITFNHQRIGLNKPQKNFKSEFTHTKKSILNVSSIEITFLLDRIKDKGILFDEYFGLKSYFETAEEYLFLRECLKNELKVNYNPAVIVSHPLESSGIKEGSDSLVYARSALFYKINGNLVYMWLCKYLFFLFRNKYVNLTDLLRKFKTGLAGINKYKELISLENEDSK